MDFTSIFSKKKTWDWVLIFSYDLNPISFFETEILNKISIRKNMTIVLDDANYKKIITSQDFLPSYMGVYYNLERIKVKNGGKFHPKMYFFLSETEAAIFIGSVNLTDSGFKRNVETLISLNFNINNLNEDDIDFLIQFYDFLIKCFLEENALLETTSPTLKKLILEIVYSSFFANLNNQRADINTERGGQRYYLLYSIEKSLFSQIVEIINPKYDEICVLSPFFSEDSGLFQELLKYSQKTKIYIPKQHSTFPKHLFDKTVDLKNNILFYAVDKKDMRDRFIHAKYYRFKKNKNKWDFITSANFTNAGLLDNGFPRNFEIGILLPSITKDFLDGSDILKEEISSFDTIYAETYKSDQPLFDKQAINIESASYSGSKIIIQFNEEFLNNRSISDFKVQLTIDGVKEGIYKINSDHDGYYIEPSLEIEGNKLIQIQLINENGDAENIKICVNREKHDPNYLPSLGATKYYECVKTGGVNGIEKAFEYARNSGKKDWLIYLLSHWNLKRIMEGIIEGKRTGDIEDQDDYVPHLPEKREEYQKNIRKRNLDNLLPIFDMYSNLQSFLQQLEEKSANKNELMNNYLKLCLPLFKEVSEHFIFILEREEAKKINDPSMCYPKYTWLHNYNKYERYMVLVYYSLEKLLKDLRYLRYSKGINEETYFDFLLEVKTWITMHTQQTITKIKKDYVRFTLFQNTIEGDIST